MARRVQDHLTNRKRSLSVAAVAMRAWTLFKEYQWKAGGDQSLVVLCVSLLGNRECIGFDGSVSTPRGVAKVYVAPLGLSARGNRDIYNNLKKKKKHWSATSLVGGCGRVAILW